MKKLITILSLSSALMLFTACSDMDKPTPLDTQAPASMGFDAADIPGDSAFGNDAGLNARDLGGAGSLGFDPDAIPAELIACTVYFGFDQYAIPSAERAKLKPVADMIKGNSSQRFALVGRTDCFGTEEYNLMLSDKRGNAVAEYLSGLGAQGGTEVVARGKAGSTPDVAKDSPQAKQDRRVDVVRIP